MSEIELKATIAADKNGSYLYVLGTNGITVAVTVPAAKINEASALFTQNWKLGDAWQVCQFTQNVANKPVIMNKDRVSWLIKMVISEMTELAQTVCDSPADALELVKSCVGTDFNENYKKTDDPLEQIAEQADAMVDAYYYMLNTAAHHGMNLSRVFNVVHGANMNKRFSDGTFHRRDDGKIIKPPGWKEPDVAKEMHDQLTNGSW